MTAEQYFKENKGREIYAHEGETGVIVGWHKCEPEKQQTIIVNTRLRGWTMNEGESQASNDIIDWELVKGDKFMYIAINTIEPVTMRGVEPTPATYKNHTL